MGFSRSKVIPDDHACRYRDLPLRDRYPELGLVGPVSRRWRAQCWWWEKVAVYLQYDSRYMIVSKQ